MGLRRTEALFGQPDGAISNIDTFQDDFVDLPSRYGGIARDPADARVRVVVGQLGTGKSLYLRRMQDATKHANDSVYSDSIQLNSVLTSEDLASFSTRLKSRGNTENWKVLWRRAIFRSVASHVCTQPEFASAMTEEAHQRLMTCNGLLGSLQSPRSPMHVAKEIITENASAPILRKYLSESLWTDAEYAITNVLRNGPAIFLYLDHLDNNFRWAPTLWSECQRGLFYTVMDFLREDTLRNKLHVIITIRDMTYASIRASEHAPRYLDPTHINLMSWNWDSMTYLLTEKLARLPEEYFVDPDDRSPGSWLGMKIVRNARPSAGEEEVGDYVLRHTRLVPRDLITLGNRICDEIRGVGHKEFTEESLREIVSVCAHDSAKSQIAQAANQVLSDLMPEDAVRNSYEHFYLQPNSYVEKDAADKIVDCIDGTGSEVLTRDALHHMNAAATEAFAAPVVLTDVLWQNGLLGVLSQKPGGHTAARFFSIAGEGGAGSRLPLSQQSSWIWHPILFDIAPNLKPVLTTPLWVR
jgi:hypothetical protein